MGKKRCCIIFCGGCNPRINRADIAVSAGKLLSELGCEVVYNDPDADFVVYLSGCSVSCASGKKLVDAPSVVIAGTSVDSITTEEKSLVIEILKRGRDHFGKFQRNL